MIIIIIIITDLMGYDGVKGLIRFLMFTATAMYTYSIQNCQDDCSI